MPERALSSHINRLFLDQGPPEGTSIGITEARPDLSDIDLLSARGSGPFKAGSPLILVVRSAPLNTPDVVRVQSAGITGEQIALALDTRRYDGPLLGNEVSIAWVEVDLGELAAGIYHVRVQETARTFHQLGQADSASGETSSLTTFDFTVQ